MLLDVSMPGVDGLEALPRVLEASPDHARRDVQRLRGAGPGRARPAELGAAAFIEKSTSLDTPHRPARRDRLGRRGRDTGRGGRASRRPSRAAACLPVDQRVLDEHLERFREVFEEAAIGMATMTLTGRLVRANRALAALLRRSADGPGGCVLRASSPMTPSGVVTAALDEISTDPSTSSSSSTASPAPSPTGGCAPRWRRCGTPAAGALYLFLQVQDVTPNARQPRSSAGARSGSGCSSRRSRTTRSSCSTRTGTSPAGTPAPQRSKGYTADEIIGQHFRVFYPPETQARRHPEHELEVALRDGHYEEEGWRVRKDGTRFWANVLITAVYDDRGRARRLRQGHARHHASAGGWSRSGSTRCGARGGQRGAGGAQRAAPAGRGGPGAVPGRDRPRAAHPVGVLGGSAETLARHWAELADEERDELLDAMTSSTGRLRRLLADLLTASRLQASALEMRTDAVPVERRRRGRGRCGRRHAHPDAEIPSRPRPDLAVHGDRDRLAQALDNLLGNALRHGAPPVHVDRDGDRARRGGDPGPRPGTGCARRRCGPGCSSGSPPARPAAAPASGSSSSGSWPAPTAARPPTSPATPGSAVRRRS